MNKVEMHKNIYTELVDIYSKKNADYGDSFSKSFDEFGMVAPIIRMTDKLNRVRNLLKSEKLNVPNESIEDTLLDLANYAIMTVIEIRKHKTENENAANNDPS